MPRFENTPGLFGNEESSATILETTCGWCQKTHPYNEEFTERVMFGDLEIAECCFEKVENAVLKEMPQILAWFIRILKARKLSTEKYEGLISEVKGALKK